jgi:hypothetical protein
MDMKDPDTFSGRETIHVSLPSLTLWEYLRVSQVECLFSAADIRCETQLMDFQFFVVLLYRICSESL